MSEKNYRRRRLIASHANLLKISKSSTIFSKNQKFDVTWSDLPTLSNFKEIFAKDESAQTIC